MHIKCINIERLATELNLLIASFLDMSSTYAFARTCRLYYEIVLPTMYKDITIEEMLGVNSLNWSFLHTFARKPCLAAAFIGANDMASFFRLPTLIKVRALDVILGDVDLSRLGTRFSNVTDIYIKDSLITKKMLKWLELCRELKSSRIDFQGTRRDMHAAPEPGLLDHLAQLHKTILERLWLGLGHNGYVPAYDKGIFRFSLPEFTRLKILRIHVRNLMEFNHQIPTGHEGPLNELRGVLPASIEVLCITSWGTSLSRWLPDHVERMMSKGQTPALRTLVVDSEIPPSSEYKQYSMKDYARLAAVCERVGIQSIFLDSSYMDSVWPQPGPIGA
ncbi:uncharacterized protein BDV14DRAFT_194691 [Aspergillus stella-maris]|uniref:uncharacterized protein n=1 Tax=Aspergillus stella-maris TaxID=1810926 RepID=UPI003CCDE1A6